MKSIERVNLTLQHKEADRIPVYPITNSVSRYFLDINYEEWTKDVNLCAESIIKMTDELDLDVITTLVDLSVEAADWGQELLYFDNKAASPSSNRVIQTIEDYKKIKQINPRETPRMKDHIELSRKLVEARGDEKAIVGFVFAPLGILSMLRGLDNIFMDLFDKSEYVHHALREITETIKELCTALIETGVHAIMFDTLYASKSIMSEDMWDEFEGVYMEEIADHVRKQGCMVMIHNCGAGPYFEKQIERMDPIAFSFLHVSAECDSYEHMKEKYKDKLTLIGHVDPTWLPTATEEEVVEECKQGIDTFAKGGGFILATGCEYPSTLGLDNARAIVKTAKEYGKYK